MSRSLRKTKKVDYKMMAEGEFADSESETGEQFTVSPVHAKPVFAPDIPVEEDRELDELRRQLAEEEDKKSALRQQIEIKELKEKLSAVQKENEELALRYQRPSHSAKQGKPGKQQVKERPTAKDQMLKNTDRYNDLTMDELRTKDNLARKVDRELAKLQLWEKDDESDSAPSSDERSQITSDEDHERTSRTKSRMMTKTTKKGMKSGRAAKPSSVVLFPQLWPHSELNTSFVDATITYDNLSIDEFVAGYSTILRSCKPESREFKARLEHLISLMYLAGRYEWKAVLSFHGAVLLDIERGRACWGDNFSYLEARTLHGYLKDIRSNPDTSNVSKGGANVFFCREYQKGKCRSSRDHSGVIRGETKFLRHICAACWLKTRSQHSHPETSQDCPFQKTVTNKD